MQILRRAEIHSDRLAGFEDGLRPASTNWPGVRPSIAHVTLPPLPSSTDRTIHTCGFVHFHSVTVPVNRRLVAVERRVAVVCEGGRRYQQHRDDKNRFSM